MEEKEGMINCPMCKGTGLLRPKVEAQNCTGCEGCVCPRCQGTGKIIWIEEVFQKEIPEDEIP
jgi:DnaJ-class molecular chaperone